MKNLENVTLGDILPDSIAKDKQVSAAAQAIDPQLRLLALNVDVPAIYASIDKLTSSQLDHIAVQYDLDVWRDSWPVTLKRSILKTAIPIKRKVGTVGAVKDALASIGSAATIIEWWQTEPKGEPHTFTIYATQSEIEGTIDEEMQADLMAMIDDAKPLRSHYKFVMQNQSKTGINVFACVRPCVIARFMGGV